MECCRECHLFTWAGLDANGRCLSCQHPNKATAFDINPVTTLQTGEQRNRRKATTCVYGHKREATGRTNSIRFVCRICEHERGKRYREKKRLEGGR